MTPEELELAKRLVAAEWWEWREGMRVWSPRDQLYGTVVECPMGLAVHSSTEGDGDIHLLDDDWLPDLHSPATGGVLLETFLPELPELPGVTTYWVSETRREWCVELGHERSWTGPTLGVACAKARLAIAEAT